MKSVNKLQQFLLSTAISLLLLIGILYGESNLYNLHNDVEQNKEKCIILKHNKQAEDFLKNKCYNYIDYEETNND
ncbi:Phi92_gp022 [Escherichia phage phi92]|uniref:Phi92_gp022 n=1 Tax=Escherichia phage phi92 TaxID=948870 RepID=I7HT78_9CAUD|nr:Phi92_gp022 [Escherichia phage phi92]CBY99450.1 Phi92_gp022 [Escherichia phage phi92]